jgi:glutamine synthetase type III
MNEGNFIRILYSTNNVTLNGVYLLIQLNDIVSEKYYNKNKCTFSVINHKELIEKIRIIEENLLKKIEINNKIPQFKIHEQLINGNIKFFSDYFSKSNNSFILKISGIWETHTHYGLTYKFTKINF